MKIGINIASLKSLHQYRGVGFYTQNLIEALKKYKPENQYILFTRTSQLPKNVDLVHYPCFDPFFLTLPLNKPCKTIVTIHDLIPLVFPDKFPRGLRGEIKWQIQKKSLGNVSAIITDSENSKRDIIRLTHFPQEKIHVVPLAPGEEFRLQVTSYKLQVKTRRKYSLPERFILYVGDVNWNKNIPGLIEAFKQLTISTSDLPAGKAGLGEPSEPRETPGVGFDSPGVEELASAKPTLQKCDRRNLSKVKLVLVGKAFLNGKLKETQEINQLIDTLGITNSVLKLGFVPLKDLVAIYNLATVYCQPSFYEGFGLPPLEAMACGVPVVVSNIPTLMEICGKAAIYVNPDDPISIKEGIEKALCLNYSNYFNTIKRGQEWVKKFSWKKVAEETVKVYKEAVG